MCSSYTPHIIRQLCPSHLQKVSKSGSHLITILMVSPQDLRSKSMGIEPRPICLISDPGRASRLKLQIWGPERVLFLARREEGGICDTDSISSLPRNIKQVEYLARKTSNRVSKDPLAPVLELQKTTFPGFITEISRSSYSHVIY